jgi:DNA-binding NtrC family response regulator
MRRVFEVLERYAGADAPVLILGETGTGKELVARALHARGRQAAGPFVPLNCGGLTPGLWESELYGHEKGAFTGAHARRPGAFEQADGGTLFLDEMGEMPLAAQARLLRVLETGLVRRVGGIAEVRCRVRVVSATHRDLSADVGAGRFRADLFHRLAILVVGLPPLRERREDILPLATELLGRLAPRGAPPAILDDSARARLSLHDWPGNVRELRNVLTRALALHGPVGPAGSARAGLPGGSPALVLGAADVEPWAGPGERRPRPVPYAARGAGEGAASLVEHERAAVTHALSATGGNRTAAARALGISRSTLREKMVRYGMAC